MINKLFEAIFYYDRDLYKHSMHVGRLAEYSAEKLGYSDTMQQELRAAGILNDYGKLCIPKTVLDAERNLTKAEMELMRQHPIISFQCVKGVVKNKDILEAIYSHHERVDGSGYPNGIKDVTDLAQVLGVCDSFDAICSARSYKEAKTVPFALSVLRKDVENGLFEPEIVEALADVVYDVGYRQYIGSIYNYGCTGEKGSSSVFGE